jgi:hypothetical protein
MINSKTLKKSRLIGTFLGACLLAAGLFNAMPKAPSQAAGVTAHHEHVEAFNLGSLFGSNDINFENFPMAPVEALAKQMAVNLQPGIKNPIHVVSVFRKELTPLAAVSRTAGMCIIVLNKNPDGWAQWNRFFKEIDDSERMNMVEVSIAHEIGHCADAQTSREAGVDLSKKTALSGEVFADIFASLYAKSEMGERSQTALNTLNHVRSEFSFTEASHATADKLQALSSKIDAFSLQKAAASRLTQFAFELNNSLSI